ncbi:MAG: major facilitator transporter [Amycolatopsis sp.]|nr:major facilitator transporter [Amycolatopsis sp.]
MLQRGYSILYTITSISTTNISITSVRIEAAMSQPQLLTAHEVRDVYGRTYRHGETDRALLGRPRSWMLWLSWAAMLAAGVQQYGFGAVVPTLTQARGWSLTEVLWAFAVWTVCQAVAAFPAARLRDSGRLSPAVAMAAGAVLSAIGLVTLGLADSLPLVFLGFSVAGGIGTGLVYATCVGTVVKWFPDRPTAKSAFTTGAFAYGCVPFVLLAGFLLRPGNRALFLEVTAAVVLVAIAGCGALLRDPPKNWWPADSDPRVWALDRTHNGSLSGNRPAVRHYRPAELFHCGSAAVLYGVVVLAAAVSLFDLAYLVTFASQGSSRVFATVGLAVLAAATGGGRVVAGYVSERWGRLRTLRVALLAGGIAQFVLLDAGENNRPAGLVFGAVLAGFGSGCCYSLLVGLVREYFGENAALQNFGVLYSAKAVGGLLGIGFAAFLVTSGGYAVAFAAAGALGIASALLTKPLTQPGRPKHLLPGVQGS